MGSDLRVCIMLLLGVSVATLSCSSSRKGGTTAGGSASGCGSASAGEIVWVSDTRDFDTTGLGFPGRFELFRVDTAGVRRFFTASRQAILDAAGKPVSFPVRIPMPEGCTPFIAGLSGAVPQELLRKYPDMLSLQATGVDRKSYDLRLDWDGKLFRGLIQTGGTTYLIEPLPSRVNGGNDRYYIYDKAYTTQTKQPFETTQKLRYER